MSITSGENPWNEPEIWKTKTKHRTTGDATMLKWKHTSMQKLCLPFIHFAIPRPVTSLGQQVGRKVFWEGPKKFEQYPIVLNYVQHIFLGGRKRLQGDSPPCAPHGYGPGYTIELVEQNWLSGTRLLAKFTCVNHYHPTTHLWMSFVETSNDKKLFR